MILFSRNATYRPKHLKRLVEKDSALFENWTHDASIIPAEFFCYWKHRFSSAMRRGFRSAGKASRGPSWLAPRAMALSSGSPPAGR